MNRFGSFALALFLLAVFQCLPARAETMRKRYTFDYDAGAHTPAPEELKALVRKKFLADFLSEHLSPNIINESGDKVEIALDPPEDYLISFNEVSASLNSAHTQITVTVQGEVDTAALVAALVQNKVITFGKSSPRVMFLSGENSDDQRAAEKLRALVFDRIRQAGLQPVVKGNAAPMAAFVRPRGSGGEAVRQSLVAAAKEFGADYLFYISTETDLKPVFGGQGFVSTVRLTYTILRPNGTLILGESTLSGEGQGKSRIEAFDTALVGEGESDGVAPQFAKRAVGQLYQGIFSDSDVISDARPTDQEKTLAIESAGPAVVQAIIVKLKAAGVQVNLLSGVSGVASRLTLQTSKSDLELFEMFTNQSIAAGGGSYRLSVAAYSENNFEVEAVAVGAQPRRNPIIKLPPRPQRQTRPDIDSHQPHMLTIVLRRRGY